MAKTSKNQILKDEQKVIKVLEENANESIGNIAEKCGFSRQKAWRIIKRLEKNNTIWGYHTSINNDKMNRNEFILLFKLKHLPINNEFEDLIVHGKIDDIAEENSIILEDNLWVHGTYDCIISFYAQNLRIAKKFQEKVMKVFNGNIKESDLLEQMVTIKKNGFTNPKIHETKNLLES